MPGFVCRHVFNDIIKPRIDEFENEVDQMMDEYTGKFSTDDGKKLKEARKDADLSVRELREIIDEEFQEDDSIDKDVPIELSSKIRRVEDGLEPIEKALDEEYIKAIDGVLEDHLDEKFLADSDEDGKMYGGFQQKYKKFFGFTDPFYLENPQDGVDDLARELRYEYYWGFKIGLGLYTMK
jgi:hypothetical protein